MSLSCKLVPVQYREYKWLIDCAMTGLQFSRYSQSHGVKFFASKKSDCKSLQRVGFCLKNSHFSMPFCLPRIWIRRFRTLEKEQFKNALQSAFIPKSHFNLVVNVLLCTAPSTRPQRKWGGVACQKTRRFTLTVGIIQHKYKTKESHDDQVAFCFESEHKRDLLYTEKASSVKTFVLCSRTRLGKLRRFHFIFPGRRK